ncbi:MAG: Stk1 family PASTA domain-containing Ser/Thr kinase [Ruminococcus sp.]|nr:Stk1 family PASTA domain-containing Ser/Thr kinase [Ruminococcus sp.]
MDNYIGKRLDGRYEITELIGMGGMADVYKAVDIMEDRTVAVKILKNEFSENEEFVRRFRNESKAIAVLSHPNIVKIYDVGFSDELQYIVMEYINGITLKEFIEQQGVLRWKDALHFTTQVLKALQHAHDRGIVHRDIKPQNIMLFTDGTIKVMDFGIARFSRQDGRTLSDKTIGSVHYISPEQARGDITDEKSDIYSVGVMLYEMLTGVKPFEADNPVAVALMHMQETPKRPRDIVASIPEPLEEIVLHAMEREPSRRYQSASQMLKDIETFRHDPDVVFGYTTSSSQDAESTIFFSPITAAEANNALKQQAQDESEEAEEDEDEEEEEGEEKKRSYVIPILAAVTVAVVIIAAFTILYMVVESMGGLTGSTNNVTIPNFIGMSITDARSEYGDVLDFVIEEENNDEYAEGIIFEQSVAEGEVKKEGAEIELTVSKGPKTEIIPDLTDQTYEDARNQLEKLGFEVSETLQNSDDVEEGRVIKTNPAVNEEAAIGSTVKVFVSKGPLQKTVKVPYVVGETSGDAKATLEKNKLTVVLEDYDTDEVEKGVVVSQSISEGQYVDVNTEITLQVSTGEAATGTVSIPVNVPIGAWGSYVISVSVNGSLVNTQTIDDAENWAGGNISVSVSGTGEETVILSITSSESGESATYGQYTVNYKDQTYTAVSVNTNCFVDITPEQTTASTEAEEETTTTTTAAEADEDDTDTTDATEAEEE